VVFYYWATRSQARHASMDYLRRVQAHQGALGRTPGWRDGLRHFLSFADTILDKTLALSGRYRFERVRFQGQEAVLKLIAQGRGAVMVTAHVGCLELIQAAATRRAHFKLNVLVHTAHAEQFNRVLERLAPERKVRLMQVSEITPATAVELAACVARGEFVAIAGDRVPLGSGKTVRVPFLGEEAAFPVGAYVLAAILKCPLLLVACVREGRGHVVHIEPLAEAPSLPRRGREAALAQYALSYAQHLERLLTSSPFDWFNFFPFWAQSPAQAAAPAPSLDNAPHEN
jgi:predicted LPLAT superfamily acyltransferase